MGLTCSYDLLVMSLVPDLDRALLTHVVLSCTPLPLLQAGACVQIHHPKPPLPKSEMAADCSTDPERCGIWWTHVRQVLIKGKAMLVIL